MSEIRARYLVANWLDDHFVKGYRLSSNLIKFTESRADPLICVKIRGCQLTHAMFDDLAAMTNIWGFSVSPEEKPI